MFCYHDIQYYMYHNTRMQIMYYGAIRVFPFFSCVGVNNAATLNVQEVFFHL